MRIDIDLGQTESIDLQLAADELLAQGADRDDELVTYFAGEPTAYPAGRLADLSLQKTHFLSPKDLRREQPRELT